MLETIREYAVEKLEAPGDADELRQRHAEWFAALATAAEEGLRGPEQEAWLTLLDRDQSNIRTAIAFLIEGDQTGMLLDVLNGTMRYWHTRGSYAETCTWFEHALARTEGHRTLRRAKALVGCGATYAAVAAYDRALALDEESVEIFRELGDSAGLARGLLSVGVSLALAERLPEARAAFDEAAQHAERAPDPLIAALATLNLAELELRQGHYGAAISIAGGAIESCRAIGPRTLLPALLIQAQTHILAGRSPAAAPLLRELLEIGRRITHRAAMVHGLYAAAPVAADNGAGEAGARFVGVADAKRQELHLKLPPYEAELVARAVTQLRGALDDERYEALVAEGASMTLEEAVELALEAVPGPEAR